MPDISLADLASPEVVARADHRLPRFLVALSRLAGGAKSPKEAMEKQRLRELLDA